MSGEQIRAPSSSTGLIRFYDVTASNILLDPKAVIAFAIAVIAIELIFQTIRF
jgi:preprotein translocase subunit Sec61beta